MVAEKMGAFTIEVKQATEIADGLSGAIRAAFTAKLPHLTWWAWTVTKETAAGSDTVAEGVSWRSVREALGCARSVAVAMIEGDELLRRAQLYLEATLDADGHW